MKRVIMLVFVLVALLSNVVLASSTVDNLPAGLKFIDPYTIVSDKNFYRDYSPLNSDGSLNAIVVIPAGTIAKWEVSEKDGTLVWDKSDNKPRLIQYLGYPANWSAIPQTKSNGDALAALILGEPVQRGSVVTAKVIGSFKLITRKGLETDKIIAVSESSPLYAVNNLEELNEKYPGVTTIIEAWFTNYSGVGGKTRVAGFLSANEAMEIINKAISEYK